MLFTIILEFEGTTSVSQFVAHDVGEAYRLWFQELRNPDRYGLDANQGQQLSSALTFDGIEQPTPLAATRNVWCITACTDKSFALLNFVATAASARSRKA